MANSSTIQLLGKPVNGEMTGHSCRFKILCSALMAESYVCFPSFATGEHFWHIRCFPTKGDVEGEIGHLSFYIFHGNEGKDIRVSFDLGLLKKGEASSSAKLITTTHTFPKCRDKLSIEKVVEGNDLKRYLKDDYFIVIFNITILSVDCVRILDCGITMFSLLIGTSKNLIASESGKEIEMASGLVQFNVQCSEIKINEGKYLDFPIFMVGEHCWLIECFYENGSLSFVINVISVTKDLKANLELGLLTKNEGLSTVKWATSTYTFGKCWDCIRFPEFINGDEMKPYLQDDYFRVICNITILSETITLDHDVSIISSTGKTKSRSTNVPFSNLQDGLYELLQNKESIDVIFDVDGEISHAHKLVLATQSSVFSAELLGPIEENQKEKIKITEMEPAIFKAMLDFIYTDMLPGLNESNHGVNGEQNQMYSIKMLQDLLAAADRYALKSLKRICEDEISKILTTDTVAHTLVLAEKYNCPDLKARCLEFATLPQNFTEVAITDGYRHLLLNCPAILKELADKLKNVSN